MSMVDLNLEEFFDAIRDQLDQIRDEVNALTGMHPVESPDVDDMDGMGTGAIVYSSSGSTTNDTFDVDDPYVNIIPINQSDDFDPETDDPDGPVVTIVLGGLGNDTFDTRTGAGDGGAFVDLGNRLAVTDGDVSILSSIENVIGTTGADVLLGSEDNNVFYGNAGKDFIAGRGGFDVAQFEGRAEDYEITTIEIMVPDVDGEPQPPLIGLLIERGATDDMPATKATLFGIEFIQFRDDSEDGGIEIFQVGPNIEPGEDPTGTIVAKRDSGMTEEDSGDEGNPLVLELLNNDDFVGVVAEKVIGVTDENGVPVEASMENGSFTIEGKFGTLVVEMDGTATYTTDDRADVLTGPSPDGLNEMPQGKEIFFYEVPGGDTAQIEIIVKGENDDASITDSGDGEDTMVVEDGSDPHGDPVPGDSHASGQLTVMDVDSGEQGFQTPASLVGTYGDFEFDTETGVWEYKLDQDREATQALNVGNNPTDTLTIESTDGTAIYNIVVNITGTNDAAVISGKDSAMVREDVPLDGEPSTVKGNLNHEDVDNTDDVWTPSSEVTPFGTFSIADNGKWEFTLDNSALAVQQLAQDDVVVLTFPVETEDGTKTDVTITVKGQEDAPTISGGGINKVENGSFEIPEVNSGSFTTSLPMGWVNNLLPGNTNMTRTEVHEEPGRETTPYGDQWLDTALSPGNTDIQQNIDGIDAGKTLVLSFSLARGANNSNANADDSVAIYWGDEKVFEISRDDIPDGGFTTYSVAVTGNGDVADDFIRIVGSGNDSAPGGQDNQGIAVDNVSLVHGTANMGMVTEDADETTDETDSLSATGTFEVADVDLDDDLTISSELLDVSGPQMVLDHIGAENLNVLMIDPTSIVVGPDASASGTVTWTYDLPNDLVQSLGQGEEINLTYVVQVEDNFGGTASQPLTIKIKGTNDKPVAEPVSGMVMEDNAEGIMILPDFSDIDKNDMHTITVSPLDGTKGAISVEDGKIVYSPNGQFENLPEGVTATDTFEYTVTDDKGASHTETVTVIVKGQNDPATISGDNEGMVIEAGQSAFNPDDHSQEEISMPTTSGKLEISDIDDGEESFQIISSLHGDYGKFTFNEATGDWDYTLNDNLLAVQILNEGDELTDQLVVKSFDGTDTETIEVTIKGTNDNPVVTKLADHEQVTEFHEDSPFETRGNLLASGHIGLKDIDSDFGLREDRNKWPDIGFPDVTEVVKIKDVSFEYDPANPNAPDVDTTLFASLFVLDFDFGEFDSSIAKLNYTFKVKDGEIEFLGHGDKLDITYNLKIMDTDGGFVETPLKVTVTGKNDDIYAEVISSPTLMDVEDDDASAQMAEASGIIQISDIDIGDDVEITADNATAMLMDKDGNLVEGVPIPAQLLDPDNLTFNNDQDIMTNGGTFDVGFDYKAAAADLDFLAHGDELVLKFPVTVSDGKDSDDELIEIVIKGTNDAPELAGVHVFKDYLVNGSFEAPDVPGTGNFDRFDQIPGWQIVNTPPLGSGDQFEIKNDGHREVETPFGGQWLDTDGSPSNTGDGFYQEIDLTGAEPGIYKLIFAYNNGTQGTQGGQFNGDESAGSAFNVSFNGDQLPQGEPERDTITNPVGNDWILVSYEVEITAQNIADNDNVLAISLANQGDNASFGVAIDAFQLVKKVEEPIEITENVVNAGQLVAKLKASDVDHSDVVKFGFPGGEPAPLEGYIQDVSGMFWIDMDTGELRVASDKAFNFEATDDGLIVLDVLLDDQQGKMNSQTTAQVKIWIKDVNEAPVITDAVVAGVVFENNNEDVQDAGTSQSVMGTIQYLDDDGTDGEDVNGLISSVPTSVMVMGPEPAPEGATFTADIMPGAMGTGQVKWTFTIQDDAFDYLPAGESVEFVYTVTIKDDNDGEVSQDVTVTVQGTNDSPIVNDITDATTLVEDGGLGGDEPTMTMEGTVLGTNASDVDDGDVLSVVKVTNSNGDNQMVATSSATVIMGVYGVLTIEADGTYKYALDPTKDALQMLAHDEEATETFTVDVSDGNGGSDDATLSIKIMGTNDTPSIVAEDGMTAEADNQTDSMQLIMATGSITTGDDDEGDVVIVTPLEETLAFMWFNDQGDPLVLTEEQEAALKAATTLTAADGEWKLSIADKELDFLGLGEELKATFDLEADDQVGVSNSTSTASVEVIIKGANDRPVVDNVEVNFDDEPTLVNDGSGNVVIADLVTEANVSDPDVNDTVSLVPESITGEATLSLSQITGNDSLDLSISIEALEAAGLLEFDPNGEVSLNGDFANVLAELLEGGDQAKIGGELEGTLEGNFTVMDDSGATDGSDKATAEFDIHIDGTGTLVDNADVDSPQFLVDVDGDAINTEAYGPDVAMNQNDGDM